MSMLTMKVIMRTFEEMLEEMPFDKITVLALVKRCEISHNTFYYHFQDIYDLLDVWLSQKVEEMLAELEDPKDWKADITAIFMACEAHPKITNHILSSLSKERLEYYLFSRSEDSITDFVRQRAEGQNLSDSQIADITEFCRFAFAGYLLKYNYRQPTPNVTEYVEHFAGLFDIFVDNAIAWYTNQ